MKSGWSKKSTVPSALTSFNKLMDKITMILKCIGMDIYLEDYRFSVLTGVLIFISSSLLIFQLYMLIFELDKYPYQLFFENTATLAITVQGISKIYGHYVNRVCVRKMYLQIVKMYKKYRGEREENVLHLCMKRLWAGSKLLTVLFTLLFISYMSYPFLMYFLKGVRVTIIPVYLPNSNIKESTFDYAINTMYQMVFITCGCCGILAADLLFLIWACILYHLRTSL